MRSRSPNRVPPGSELSLRRWPSGVARRSRPVTRRSLCPITLSGMSSGQHADDLAAKAAESGSPHHRRGRGSRRRDRSRRRGQGGEHPRTGRGGGKADSRARRGRCPRTDRSGQAGARRAGRDAGRRCVRGHPEGGDPGAGAGTDPEPDPDAETAGLASSRQRGRRGRATGRDEAGGRRQGPAAIEAELNREVRCRRPSGPARRRAQPRRELEQVILRWSEIRSLDSGGTLNASS